MPFAKAILMQLEIDQLWDVKFAQRFKKRGGC
jgi:hypothetical protein